MMCVLSAYMFFGALPQVWNTFQSKMSMMRGKGNGRDLRENLTGRLGSGDKSRCAQQEAGDRENRVLAFNS